MKKIMIITMMAFATITSAFATETKSGNWAANTNFKTSYSNASDVSWSNQADYSMVSFLFEGTRMQAFYTQSGQLIGTAKGITLDELPVKAKRTFAKKFDGYTVKEAIRFDGMEEGAFYIAADGEKDSVILQVYDNGDVSLMRKSSK